MIPGEKNRKGARVRVIDMRSVNVTGATRFVWWDGAKSTESDMSNQAVGLLDPCGDACVGPLCLNKCIPAILACFIALKMYGLGCHVTHI